MNPPPLLTEEDAIFLLDAKYGGRWRRDREGWVTLERRGIAWRVHYRRGKLLEVWLLGQDACLRFPLRRVAG